MAALAVAFASSYLSNLITNTTAVPISYYFFSFPTHKTQPQPMLLSHLLPFFFFFFAFTLSFTFSLFFLCRSLRRQRRDEQIDPAVKSESLSKLIDGVREIETTTHLPHSLLLEIFPSDPPKWASMFAGDPAGPQSAPGDDPEASSVGRDSQRLKKKKRRAKKNRLASKIDDNDGGSEEEKGLVREMSDGSGLCRIKPELVCLYPFTSASSATQRKIKQQYDQLVKCNEKKGLTLAQFWIDQLQDAQSSRPRYPLMFRVAEFANCLVEARTELHHKSEVIKRKFTITKALLFKADRSSIDRLRQQIYKLEVEQKRLEEDAFVYNWLQQQLKLSPAYKKMLEISVSMEKEAKSNEMMAENDAEFVTDISFEELLAQEKKDSFWQKNGKSRTWAS